MTSARGPDLRISLTSAAGYRRVLDAQRTVTAVDEPQGANDPLAAALARLPHRPPFRFVDSLDRLEAGVVAEARWHITGDEAWLAGHFPGNPVVPGVLQLEALAQTGAVALLADERYTGKLPLFGGVEGVRWRRIVRPGDTVVMRVELERLSGRGGWGQARAEVGGDETCRARLFFVIA